MKMLPALLFVLLTTLVATTQASDGAISHQIHLLRPRTGSRGSKIPGVSCLGWRLAVETRNILNWTTVPASCEGYVGHYMQGHQYREDCRVVTNEAFVYVRGLNLTKDDKNLWVFDIDESSISNIPYYAHHGFGVEVYNATAFNAWVLEGRAPALPETLKLYNKLVDLGVKIAFLTGRSESQRVVTEVNLRYAGYLSWEKLILKNALYSANTTVVYKSSERKQLEQSGYRIIGNMGDQWSDVFGTNVGGRTFKLPDPMYYIS